MKIKYFYLVVIIGTLVATTNGTKDILLPLLPALPLPDAKPTPEYTPKPDAPVCQTLTMNHTGFNATQEPGHILLCQPNPAPTQPTNVVGTTTSRVVKTTTTTNTTTTEVRTITTTTTTTIEATTTSTNSTVPMDVKSCVLSDTNGTQYNWWQILLETGGKPGTKKGEGNFDNAVLDSPPVNPCIRPLESQDPEKYGYKYVDSDGASYIRSEIAYPRFHGSPYEFSDVRGELVWKPSKNTLDKTTYLVLYILDDTGFWVDVRTTMLRNFKMSLSETRRFLFKT